MIVPGSVTRSGGGNRQSPRRSPGRSSGSRTARVPEAPGQTPPRERGLRESGRAGGLSNTDAFVEPREIETSGVAVARSEGVDGEVGRDPRIHAPRERCLQVDLHDGGVLVVRVGGRWGAEPGSSNGDCTRSDPAGVRDSGLLYDLHRNQRRDPLGLRGEKGGEPLTASFEVCLLSGHRQLLGGAPGQLVADGDLPQARARTGRRQRERLSEGDAQLTMSMLGMLLGNQPGGSAAPPVPAPETPFAAHTRARPTGRKPLPEKLPRQRLRRD